MYVRNAWRSAAVAALLVAVHGIDAHAVDPVRHPSGSLVPQPQDPNFIPGTGGTAPYGASGTFDPFNPTGGFGTSTLPPGGGTLPTNPELRVSPPVAPAPPVSTPTRWRLGIYSMDTDTGVRIIRKSAGSPADAAGLEEDDLIVAVAGYQVGLIDGQRRELGQVFNDHADTDGYVLLLVHDHRSRNLVNIPVRLEARFERITGTVTYRDNFRLPRDAQVNVELHEIVRPGIVNPIVNTVIRDIRQLPIPFTIDYDPTIIDPRREYVVHASITSGNQTLFTTRNPYRVITDGYPRVVDLSLYNTASAYGNQQGYADGRDEQVEQIVAWFREYLQRDPRLLERDVYTNQLSRGGSLIDAQAELLGHNEFYLKQCGANDQRYVERLYEVVLGRRPSPQEVDAWLNRLHAHNNIRTDLARDFLDQVSKQR